MICRVVACRRPTDTSRRREDDDDRSIYTSRDSYSDACSDSEGSGEEMIADSDRHLPRPTDDGLPTAAFAWARHVPTACTLWGARALCVCTLRVHSACADCVCRLRVHSASALCVCTLRVHSASADVSTPSSSSPPEQLQRLKINANSIRVDADVHHGHFLSHGVARAAAVQPILETSAARVGSRHRWRAQRTRPLPTTTLRRTRVVGLRQSLSGAAAKGKNVWCSRMNKERLSTPGPAVLVWWRRAVRCAGVSEA